MSIEREIAEARLERANTYLHWAKNVAGVYVLIVITVLMVQLYFVQQSQLAQLEATQSSLEVAITDSENQHARTQEYIRCVASALLLPLAVRNEQVFDRCGIDTEATPTQGSAQPSAPATTAPVQESSVPAPSASQPTTSSPPDPDPAPADQQDGFVQQLVTEVLDPVRLLTGGAR